MLLPKRESVYFIHLPSNSCCAVSLGSAPDVRFASGKSALNIPFKIFNNHVYFQVSVNNAKPLWFVLDTGARNIINTRHARTLGLELDPAGQTTVLEKAPLMFPLPKMFLSLFPE
jgi:predicted aspartyl protease